MQVVHPRCAGLDVHQHSVVACVRLVQHGAVHQQVQTFATTTAGLLQLSDWLSSHGCTHVALEATGVYWKPVWHILESSFELLLAHAAHIRNVPGRKSDVSDATWIANLLAHGLIRPSFVPPTVIQELRDLTRTRKQLVREVAQHLQRIQKVLEDANLKLTGLISDLLGVSGRAILDALVQGESDPQKLVQLVHSRLKAPRERLLAALHGQVRTHHRFLLKLHLGQIDALRRSIAELEDRLGEALRPFEQPVTLLCTIPGVARTTAQVLVAEIGLDMSRFASAGHLVSWAGLCPRSDQSAGKQRSTRLRKGAPWLKTTLSQAAWAAVRKPGCALRAQFLRLRARRGPMKAIIAVAASMLQAAYHILRTGQPYRELGENYLEARDREQTTRRLIRRLKRLGLEVQIRPAAA